MIMSAFFSSALAQAIGWTLIHSLWIGLLVVGLVKVSLRFIPSRAATLRYYNALAGLGLIVACSAGVFIALFENPESSVQSSSAIQNVTNFTSTLSPASSTVINVFDNFIQTNMNIIVGCWLTGMVLFAFRITGAGVYVSLLRKESIVVNNEWLALVKHLSRKLDIQKSVSLAESSRILVPMVLGYVKPVIIIPAGMFAGLPPGQLETILLHELAHIKRHDYLVNLLQMVVESILFFNPFVWMLSNIVRNEREHCCDDVVLSYGGHAATYAAALVQLEEVRLHRVGMALALAENKNQLLNRIKRLMEKSVKNYSGRERIVPIILLVLGLICASWITINGKQTATAGSPITIMADTIIDNTTKKTWRRIVTIDADGTIHEEGDSNMPSPPEPLDIPEPAEPIESFKAIAALPPFSFSYETDSISWAPFPPSGAWDKFDEEFEKSFKEKFADFYSDHQKDIDKMMEEMKEKFAYADEAMARHHEEQAHAILSEIEIPEDIVFQAQADAQRSVAAAHEAQALNHAQVFEAQQKGMKQAEAAMRKQADALRVIEKNLQRMEKAMQQFDKELKQELIKDGYIKEGQSVQHIRWDDAGDIEVDNIKIKPSHVEKYKRMHRKYFNEKTDTISPVNRVE